MATFGTFADGQVLSAAELNAAGTYTAYTPTWTQSATITKTTNLGQYMLFNKLVVANFSMTATSAGTANNVIVVGLPVTASANNSLLGQAYLIDVSVGVSGTLYPLVAAYLSTTTMAFYAGGGNETDYATGQAGLTASLVPVTIASGDIIVGSITYRAA